MRASWLVTALAAFAAAGALSACEGGCGETPAEKSSTPSSSGGGGSRPSSGSGQVSIAKRSRYDSRKGKPQPGASSQVQSVAAEQGASSAMAQSPAVAAAKPPLFEPVDADSYRASVLEAKALVLVLISGRRCGDCDRVQAAIEPVAAEFSPRYKFARLDAGGVGATGLLPKGMRLLPLPAYIIYENGKELSRRQGLPFRSDAGETDAAYKDRLGRWFRDALTQKDLNFASR